MAQILTLDQFPQFNFVEFGELSLDASAAGVTLTLRNTDQFDDQHLILVGNAGEETSEIRVPSDVTGNVVTIDALSYAHAKGTKVYMLRGSKIRVYRAPNVNGLRPALDTYTLVDDVDLQADQVSIQFTDDTGGSGYWYLFTFYNYINSEESEKVYGEAVRGGTDGHYATIEDIRSEAGLTNATFIEDSIISMRRDQAEGEVKGVLASVGYVLPLVDSGGNEFTPSIIESVTLQLASGLLLKKEYGTNSPNTTKDGESKVKSARDILKQIAAGTLLLLDSTGTQLAFRTDISGWPDDTTTDNSFDGGRPEPKVFGMNKTY